MRQKVLVVDDEPSVLSSTAGVLRELGFEVATCQDAGEILPALAREQPDLLLQDVRMPGLDLERLVFDLRADPRWRRLPVVIFTASMDVDEIGERVQAAGTIEKPFRPRDLLVVLSAALAGVAA